MYYVYILKSLKDHKLYIGYSINYKQRIKEHNNGRVSITKNRKPFKLIYYEACLNKTDAIKRENQLKTGFGKGYINRRLSAYLNNKRD